MKVLVKIYLFFGATCGVLFLGVIALAFLNSVWNSLQHQWDHPETKLWLLEDRIASIPAEFIRRSPQFEEMWEAFKECGLKEDCDSGPILDWRDAIVQAKWPEIFDRLVIYADWGNFPESARSRDRFFKYLEEYGAEYLRNECIPDIEFWALPSGTTYSRVDGFECGDTELVILDG